MGERYSLENISKIIEDYPVLLQHTPNAQTRLALYHLRTLHVIDEWGLPVVTPTKTTLTALKAKAIDGPIPFMFFSSLSPDTLRSVTNTYELDLAPALATRWVLVAFAWWVRLHRTQGVFTSVLANQAGRPTIPLTPAHPLLVAS